MGNRTMTQDLQWLNVSAAPLLKSPALALPATYVDVLRQHAAEHPDAIAGTFLDSDGAEIADFSYAELDRRARAIAVRLLAEGAAGDRALLLYPPGLDFVAGFFGCLYAGVIAVPMPAPQPGKNGRGQNRIAAA